MALASFTAFMILLRASFEIIPLTAKPSAVPTTFSNSAKGVFLIQSNFKTLKELEPRSIDIISNLYSLFPKSYPLIKGAVS